MHLLTPQHLNVYIRISSPTCSKQEFWLPYPLSKLPPTSSFSVNSYFIKPVALGKTQTSCPVSPFLSLCTFRTSPCPSPLPARCISNPLSSFHLNCSTVIQGPSAVLRLSLCPLHKLPSFHSTTYLLQSILCPAASETLKTKQNNATRTC